MEIYNVLIVTIILVSLLYYKLKVNEYDLTESYAIGQKLIQELVDTFVKAKIIPYASIPNNELHPDELENFRNECAKYVLHLLTNCDAYNKIKHVYTPEMVVCYVDKYFTEYVVKIRGVKL